jgi:hypothetical protein
LEATSGLGENTIANLDAIRRYCENNQVDVVVFTGGIFNRSKGQVISAAAMMADWWHDYGPRGSAAVIEGESKTTRQNIDYVVSRLHQHGYNFNDCEVTAVSERYHLLGIRLLFWLLHSIRAEAVASDFRISFREKLARLLRLPMYLWDPRGVGWLSRRKLHARSQP